MTTATIVTEKFLEVYAEVANPKKNAAGNYGKYANLEELLNVTRPLLSAASLALVQEPVSGDDGAVGVHTRLIHSSGGEIDFGSYTVPLAKHDAQGAGSAITYTRRYAIASIFGLAQEDDDGEGAKSAPSSASAPRSAPQAAKSSPAPVDGDPAAHVVEFGKHKGTTILALASDPETAGYVSWMANQDGDKPGFAAAKAFLAGTKATASSAPADYDEAPEYTDADV